MSKNNSTNNSFSSSLRSNTSNNNNNNNNNYNKQVPFRTLAPPDTGDSSHFLPALQVIAHVLIPLRKALIHFHFLCKQNPDVAKSKIEYQVLSTLGQIFQAMMAPIPITTTTTPSPPAPTKNSNDNDSDDDDSESNDDDELKLPPIDPTPFYKVLIPCLTKTKKTIDPRDATQALQILLEVLQSCCRQIPVTSHLWSALLDQAGVGVVAKQSTVGQCKLEDDGGAILQRTLKESIILWCPWKLPLMPTLPLALQKACAKQPSQEPYDFDTKPYDFEVRIPLWNTTSSSSSSTTGSLDGASLVDSSTWKTTKSMQLTSLTTFLFLAIDRFEGNNDNNDNNGNGTINTAEVEIPKRLDVSKLCGASTTRTSASSQRSTSSRQYELVAGILVDDEEDYVAILKNFDVSDPEDEEAWKLMETEEVIPMTESDVLDFLKGEGENEGGPCGTVLVYQRCDDNQSSTVEMNQILSDIIISHVSGTLDGASPDYYYEEEVIEDGEEE
jgi:hypothetical protein